jgi:hypothetical protein
MADRRKPQLAPGPAHNKAKLSDDFMLPSAMYYDAIHHYKAAQSADAVNDSDACDRYKRAAIFAAFAFFEAQLNQIAFAYAEAHETVLGQIEKDVLEEMETVVDERGDILRKKKFYRTESRFTFLVYFLTGKDFDRSGPLWNRFLIARNLRDQYIHPKPPFDTWSLSLEDVHSTIEVVHDMFITLATMMDSSAPLWLRPVDEVLGHFGPNS